MLESGRCADLVDRVEFKGCRRANFGEGEINERLKRIWHEGLSHCLVFLGAGVCTTLRTASGRCCRFAQSR